jgi:hypothetical protein
MDKHVVDSSSTAEISHSKPPAARTRVGKQQLFESVMLYLLKPLQRRLDPTWFQLIWEWPQIVSHERARHLEPMRLQKTTSRRGLRHVLLVHCHGWSAFEAQFQSAVIIQLINQYLGLDYVQDVQFRDHSRVSRTVLRKRIPPKEPKTDAPTLEEALLQLESRRNQRR